MSSRETFGHLKECLEKKFLDACFGKNFSPKTNLGEKAYEYLKNNVEECFKYTCSGRYGLSTIPKRRPALWWTVYNGGMYDLSVFGYKLIIFKGFWTAVDIKLVTPVIYKERSKTSSELQLEIENTIQYFEKIFNLKFQDVPFDTRVQMVEQRFLSEDFVDAVFEFALIQEFFNKTMEIGPNLDLD